MTLEPATAEVLLDLIKLRQEIKQAAAKVAALPWDSDQSCAHLTPADAIRLLNFFGRGKCGPEEVELWAETLEVREDVEFDGVVGEVLFELANPSIEGPLTRARARALVEQLTVHETAEQQKRNDVRWDS